MKKIMTNKKNSVKKSMDKPVKKVAKKVDLENVRAKKAK
jgi:hypothetical protein